MARGGLYGALRDIDRNVRKIERARGIKPPKAGVFNPPKSLPVLARLPKAGVFGGRPKASVPHPSDASRRAGFQRGLAVNRRKPMPGRVKSPPRPRY
jgi:hypothetical protein